MAVGFFERQILDGVAHRRGRVRIKKIKRIFAQLTRGAWADGVPIAIGFEHDGVHGQIGAHGSEEFLIGELLFVDHGSQFKSVANY